MDEGHRPDAVLAVLEHADGLRVLEVAGLEAEQGGDDLHVVLDPVVDLLEQDLLLVEGGLQGFFAPLPLDGHGGLGGHEGQHVHVLRPVPDALRVGLDDHDSDRPVLDLQGNAQPVDRRGADQLHLARLYELLEPDRIGQERLARAEDVVREAPAERLGGGGLVELIDEIGEADHPGLLVVDRDVRSCGPA